MTTNLAAEVADRTIEDEVGPQGLHSVARVDVVKRIKDNRAPYVSGTDTLDKRGKFLGEALDVKLWSQEIRCEDRLVPADVGRPNQQAGTEILRPELLTVHDRETTSQRQPAQ